MKLLSTVATAALVFLPAMSFGHARLTSPVPRNNNAGIKNGPCGNVPRTGINLNWTVGQTVTLEWEETVNHPGKFLFAISTANDANFQMVKMVLDDQNAGVPLPHKFSSTFVVPNTPCQNCTFQMIQSMEENPNNPTFYYSCADINILPAAGEPTATPTPTPITGGGGDNTSQSGGSPVTTVEQKFGGYGCGTIGAIPPSGPGAGGGAMIASIFAMFMTLLVCAALRKSQLSPAYVQKRPRQNRV